MKTIIAILGLTVMVCSLRAQTNTLTLAAARCLALERNWDLLAARTSVDAATAQWLMAREFPNPNLSATSAKIGDRENATPAGNGVWARSYDTVFALNQLIEIGGKRRDRQDAARAGVLGAKARFLDARRLLDQGVTKAYLAALLAGENARVLHESAAAMQHEQAIAEARFHAGDLAESDLKQIQVAAGQYVLQENSALAAAVPARTAVEILLGVAAPKGYWQPADVLDQIVPASPPAARRTNALRPDVLAAQTDLRAAEAGLKLQRAERLPDPTLALQYEHNPPGGGPPVDTIGLGISFPLPLWNQNRGAIAAAQAAVDQARLALAKLQAQMAADEANAEAAWQEASNRLARYREEIRPRSAAAREAVAFKFEKGAATLVDLLEAERTDNDVRLAAVQAMADAASAAADLAAARQAITETQLSDRP